MQFIRTAAIIQLLLGNIGRPGGGILALRGHASIQGSTDIPTLYNILPGYLPMPNVAGQHDFDDFVEANMAPAGWWGHFRAYWVSLMKAYFGEAATEENDWLFGSLPRIDGDHSVYFTVEEMLKGNVKGYLLAGENPAVGNSNSRAHRLGLAKNLDWLVVRDLVEIETAAFWYDAPEIETGELKTEEIGTEVFFLPAARTPRRTARSRTRSGCCSGTTRRSSRRATPLDLWFYYHLGRLIRQKLADSQEPRDELIKALTWDYPTRRPPGDPERRGRPAGDQRPRTGAAGRCPRLHRS